VKIPGLLVTLRE